MASRPQKTNARGSTRSRLAIPRAARRCAALLLCSAVTSVSGATLDADALISRLARVPPATIAFSEARFSPLLTEPLVVSGRLSYLGQGSFDRDLDIPYAEHTAIRGESVSVERAGEPPRTFALKRAPELGALLMSFVALLSGDAAAVAREFTMTASGDTAVWTIELTPMDARQRRRLQRIVVSGAENEPRCLAVIGQQGGGSVMLLGESAAAEVSSSTSLEALLQRCSAK